MVTEKRNDPIQPLIDYIDQHMDDFDERARAALITLRELAMADEEEEEDDDYPDYDQIEGYLEMTVEDYDKYFDTLVWGRPWWD